VKFALATHTIPLVLSVTCLYSHFANFQVKFFDPFIQEEREVRAGRMECTMQNLADSLTSRSAAALAGPAAGAGAEQALMDRLSTFMVYNMRRKVGDALAS
jgi:hypothetical protein